VRTVQTPNRESVVAILAAGARREPDSVPETVDSLGVAWLIAEADRRFGIELELDDELLVRMSTVTGAVEVLQEAYGQQVRAGG
jgi:hypothetical protein